MSDSCGCGAPWEEGVIKRFPLTGWKIKQQKDPNQQSAKNSSHNLTINLLSQLLCLSACKHVQCGFMQYSMRVCAHALCACLSVLLSSSIFIYARKTVKKIRK